MILPCEDSKLATEVEGRKSHLQLGRYDNLPNLQECALTCILDKEIQLMIKINHLKQALERQKGYAPELTFQIIDSTKMGIIDINTI